MNDDTLLNILSLSGRGYCCSQIIILHGLQYYGGHNPELVRAVSGLCQGIGSHEHTCGVLTGAACLLGLYAGKGEDSQQEHENLPDMLDSLSDWFTEFTSGYSGVRCKDILHGAASAPDPQICGHLVAETIHQCLNILVDNGFDPAEPPHDH